jgi:hypothetical protein
MFFQFLLSTLSWMADAWANPEKLPHALFMTGSVEVLLSLIMYIFRPPQGIFVSHGEAYHGALICAGIWGVATIVTGIWFYAPELRPRAWLAIAFVLLGITTIPLLLVLALGLGSFLAVKTK